MSSALPVGAAPPFVRPDLAYEQFVALPDFTGAIGVLYTVPGNWYEEVLSFTLNVTTSAAAGTRQLSLQVLSPSGRLVVQMPSAMTQAAGTQAIYEFAPAYTSGIAIGTTAAASPFPAILIPSQYQIRQFMQFGDAGDVSTGINMYTRRYPSGPYQTSASAVTVATPVLA